MNKIYKKDQSITMQMLEDSLTRFAEKIVLSTKRGFDEVDNRFEEVGKRFEVIEKNLEEMGAEIRGLNNKISGINSRLDDMSERYVKRTELKKSCFVKN